MYDPEPLEGVCARMQEGGEGTGGGEVPELVADFRVCQLLGCGPAELAALTYEQVEVQVGCAEGKAIADWARHDAKKD